MTLSDHLRLKDWTFSATSRAAQRRNEFALFVLIASLGMFFAAAVVGYLLIRLRAGPAAHAIDLPHVLWLSTVLAVFGSTFLWRALRSVRRERQDLFRRQLLAAFVLGAGFCLSQSIGLSSILREHFEAAKNRPAPAAIGESPAPPPVIGPRFAPSVVPPPLDGPFPVRSRAALPPAESRLEGLLFVLILLHGLHFAGGMTALTIVTRRGFAGRYDHEYHAGVRLCAVYWRFLDVVWIALFSAFLLTA